jgi:hypothetical protein
MPAESPRNVGVERGDSKVHPLIFASGAFVRTAGRVVPAIPRLRVFMLQAGKVERSAVEPHRRSETSADLCEGRSTGSFRDLRRPYVGDRNRRRETRLQEKRKEGQPL